MKRSQANEIIRCGTDSVHFINNYVKIQHPTKGLITFDTYDFQDECLQAFDKHRFNIVLKSRQLGLSTITAAYCVWMAIFHKDKEILVIATKLSTAMNFITKVRVMLDNIPKWLILPTYDPTKQSISFNNGCKITAVPTSDDAGRSSALSLLIVDEAAFIKDFDNIWTGLYPTLSEGGNAIILSTPNGIGGQYHRLWQDAENGQNDFNAIRLPWNVHPTHDETWFKKETKNLPQRKISQEFLCDFLGSGDTFLDSESLEYIRSNIKQPIEKLGPKLGVWIWKKPEQGVKYAITSDVARGDAADYSTFTIINYHTCEVVAEYMGKIPPNILADLIFEFGTMYNTALACVERNTFGHFTNVRLKDLSYPRLYCDKATCDPYDYKLEPNDDPGFTTNVKNRQVVLAKLEESLRTHAMTTYSQRLYDQLLAFVWHGNKAQASKDSNDDLVISSALSAWLVIRENNANDKDASITRAMLEATSVDRRDKTTLPGDIESAQPLVNPAVRGFNSQTMYKPQDAMNGRFKDYQDFSWLYK